MGDVFRIPDFDLKPAQILENVPSPVLAKLLTRIGQIANRYWPNRQPVLTKSPTGIGQTWGVFELLELDFGYRGVAL